MMSLIKEFVNQADLKTSDGSDAGKYDVADKAKSTDVKFSLMRNTINTDGTITGSDVANYLEKAKDLNDEVDTVLYGLETDDGKVVKVYVNAAEADKFEEEMKKMLGMEDDIEAAINDLATKFDIVDVIWPEGEGPAEGDGPGEGEDLNLDDDLGMDGEDDDDFEEIASTQSPLKGPANSEEEAAATDELEAAEDEEAAAEDEEAAAEDEASEKPPASDEEDEEEAKAKKKPATDDKHSKLKNVGKNMKVKEDLDYHQGDNMSIGSKFLNRVLSEAKEDRDGVMDGFDIQMDSQTRMIAAKLRYKLPKQIVAMFALMGIPGTKLNTEGIVDGVTEAAEMLRQNISVRRAFLDFYKAYATAAGKSIKSDEVVTEARLKRGNYLQKMLETILVKLGLPEELVTVTGPGVVGAALYRASKTIEENSELKTKLRMLAMRMGIKPADAMSPVEDEVVKEAAAVGTSGTVAPAAAPAAGQAAAQQTPVEVATQELLMALGINAAKLPSAVRMKMTQVQRGDKNAGPQIVRLMNTLTAKLSMRGRELQ